MDGSLRDEYAEVQAPKDHSGHDKRAGMPKHAIPFGGRPSPATMNLFIQAVKHDSGSPFSS